MSKSRSRRRKQNAFARYFSDFGLKQVSDLLLLVGAIVMLVGVILHFQNYNIIVPIIGSIMIAVGSGIAVALSCTVLFDKEVKRRSPEYKKAMVSVIFAVCLLILAVLCFIFALRY